MIDQDDNRNRVTIYGNTTCAYCGAARMLLTKKTVEFEDIVITDNPRNQEEMFAKSGSQTVPQIFIGETLVGGFDDLCALDKSGKLDELLAG